MNWDGSETCCQCVEVLLKAGAGIDSITLYGKTPIAIIGNICSLNYWSILENEKLFKLLLQYGAIIHPSYDARFLLYFAAHGRHRLVRTLLQKGIPANKTNHNWKNSLHLATERGLIVTSKKLIASAVDINAKDKHLETALSYASAGGHDELTKFLIEKGADPKYTVYPDALRGNHIPTSASASSSSRRPSTEASYESFGLDVEETQETVSLRGVYVRNDWVPR
jgi:ankyrin repeat protein